MSKPKLTKKQIQTELHRLRSLRKRLKDKPNNKYLIKETDEKIAKLDKL